MLILIRGLPGSGKSTLAKQLVRHSRNKHFEADQYFVDEHGVYRFIPSELKAAHGWCMDAAERALFHDPSITVVVSNTFSREWEVVPYVQIAKATGHDCYVAECNGHHQSIHGVPHDAIDRMRGRWTALDDFYYLHVDYPIQMEGIAIKKMTFRKAMFGA